MYKDRDRFSTEKELKTMHNRESGKNIFVKVYFQNL